MVYMCQLHIKIWILLQNILNLLSYWYLWELICHELLISVRTDMPSYWYLWELICHELLISVRIDIWVIDICEKWYASHQSILTEYKNTIILVVGSQCNIVYLALNKNIWKHVMVYIFFVKQNERKNWIFCKSVISLIPYSGMVPSKFNYEIYKPLDLLYWKAGHLVRQIKYLYCMIVLLRHNMCVFNISVNLLLR
jgi:hypothetical protein